jgi:uncharacterized repeat protein (TIGR01451 family)
MEMKSIKLISSAVVTGVVLAGTFSSQAYAWHPNGVITKYVTNQTAAGQMADADTTAAAVAAKPGDTLKYTIVIENKGAADSRGWNDMHYTVLTDNLPTGVELVSDPAKRTITENIGVIKAGQKVTKEYVVKVTSTKNGDVIKNEACFTGDSEVKDNKQKGCNPAVVKVNVPETPKPPVEPPKPPEQPKQEILSAATELPQTGAGNWLVPAGLATGLGYAGNMLRLKRRNSKRES